MMPFRYGFTFLEFLITLALMILVYLFTVPSYKFFIFQARNQVMSSQLLQAINLARSEALMRSEIIILCKSGDLKSCSGQWQDGYIVKTKDKVLFTFTNHSQGVLHWRAFPSSEDALQFLPSGFPDAENGTFWYCEKNAMTPSWAIVLNQVGRVRLIFPNQVEEIIDDKGKALNCV